MNIKYDELNDELNDELDQELDQELDDELNDELNDELDDEWINNFEKTDKFYQEFYKDELYYINLKFVYINKSNEIEKIKMESFLMNTPNYITREEILNIIKNTSIQNDKRYTLLSILKYNITLDADDIKTFLKDSNDDTPDNENFLKLIQNIDAIKFDKTINMFQDLNDLIFVYYEKISNTKQHNNTKRIYLRKNTKTKRKQYKD